MVKPNFAYKNPSPLKPELKILQFTSTTNKVHIGDMGINSLRCVAVQTGTMLVNTSRASKFEI